MIVERQSGVTFVVPIPLHTIKVGFEVNFALYSKNYNNKFHRVLEKGALYDEKLKTKFLQNNKEEFFINVEDKDEYGFYMTKLLKNIAVDTTLSLNEKSLVLYDYASKIVEEIFDDPNSKITLAHTKRLVHSTVDVVLSEADSLSSFIDISSLDYYTHTHSVDVAVHAIGFGHFIGIEPTRIKKLGYAALLHDIGKSKIDKSILYKKDYLSEDEFKKIKRHPVSSYFILKSHDEADKEVLDGVKHHHEKFDGSGYPLRLKGTQIPLFARIISIADVFSALTTKREYKKAYTSFEALNIMKTEMSGSFDNELLVMFIKLIAKRTKL